MASIVERPDRGRIYVYYYDQAGRHRGKSFPANQRREAKRFAAEVECTKAEAGPATIDLQSAVVYYLEDRKAVLAIRSWERYRSVLVPLAEQLQRTRLHHITPTMLATWRNERLKIRAATTVRNDLKALKAFFRWCVGRKWITEDPSATVESPRIKRKIRAHLDPEHLTELLTVAKAEGRPEFYLIAVLAARAGLRRNEILFLPWSMVDFKNKTITIEGKSKEPRVIPMSREVEQALLDWPQSGPQVFPPIYKCSNCVASPDLGERFNKWLREKGYGITCHGLRHSFAVALVSRGGSERAIGDLLGHQDLQTVRIYARSHLDYLRKLIDQPPDEPAGQSPAGSASGPIHGATGKPGSPSPGPSPKRWQGQRADTTGPASGP